MKTTEVWNRLPGSSVRAALAVHCTGGNTKHKHSQCSPVIHTQNHKRTRLWAISTVPLPVWRANGNSISRLCLKSETHRKDNPRACSEIVGTTVSSYLRLGSGLETLWPSSHGWEPCS